MPNFQGVWDLRTQFQYAGEWPTLIQIAVFSHSNAALDQFNMATEGSVTDFGTISLGEATNRAGVGSSTRGVFNGGEDSNAMTFITFASADLSEDAVD